MIGRNECEYHHFGTPIRIGIVTSGAKAIQTPMTTVPPIITKPFRVNPWHGIQQRGKFLTPFGGTPLGVR